MSLDKKGAEYVRNAIISLVVLVVLASLFINFVGPGKTFASDSVCEISLGVADTFKGFTPRLCYTKDLKFDYEDTEAVKKEIAKQMVSCFDTFGRGTGDVAGSALGYSNTQCFKCARLNFTDFEGTIGAKDISDYLLNEKKGNLFYWNYFKLKNEEARIVVALEGNLERNKRYGVVYMEGVNSGFWERVLKISVIGATASSKFRSPKVALVVGAVGILTSVADLTKEGLISSDQKSVDGILFTEFEDTDVYCGGELK